MWYAGKKIYSTGVGPPPHNWEQMCVCLYVSPYMCAYPVHSNAFCHHQRTLLINVCQFRTEAPPGNTPLTCRCAMHSYNLMSLSHVQTALLMQAGRNQPYIIRVLTLFDSCISSLPLPPSLSLSHTHTHIQSGQLTHLKPKRGALLQAVTNFKNSRCCSGLKLASTLQKV